MSARTNTTPRDLTPGQLGQRCTFRHLGLAVSGVLMGVRPETVMARDGAGEDSDLLLGTIDLEIGDGWTLIITVPLPPNHPITLEPR